MLGALVVALVPAVLLIAFGGVLRRIRFLPDAFWPGAERLSYYVLLPALLAQGIATADLGAVPVGRLALCVMPAIVLVTAALVLARPWLGIDDPAFTSVVQGAIRFNTYVGLSLAVELYGPPGLALAAVSNALIVPTVNVACALIFARYGAVRVGLGTALVRAALNPLVLGCLAGAALQLLGLRLPAGLDATVRALGSASLPLGLLCVGAAFDPGAIGVGRRAAFIATLAKFVGMPVAVALLVRLTGLSGPPATVAVLFATLPTASSAYIMARQLGGDAPLMAGVVALQTMLAAGAIPAALLLLAG